MNPLRSALLRRAASIGGVCPDNERDAILARCFPHLDRDSTIAQLQRAREAHQARQTIEASRIIEDLAKPPEEP